MTVDKSISNRVAVAVVALSAISPGAVLGSTFSAFPSADAFVTPGPSGNLANNNYGGAGTLAVAAAGLPQGEFQTVLQFNLAPAVSGFDAEFGAGNWSIQSVTLQLTATVGGNPIFNTASAGQFGISWMQNDSWQEGSGTPSAQGTPGISYSTLNTFLSAGDESLGTFSYNGATSGATIQTLTLTPGFRSDVAAGGNVSLRLLPADSAVSAAFNSRSFGTAPNRPVINVTAVPEPGTIGLAGLGLALAAWRIRSGRSR